MPSFDVIVPTVGAHSLVTVLEALRAGPGPRPVNIVLVDDRPRPERPLLTGRPPEGVVVLRSHGRGRAAARNVGWRWGSAEWVAFLDQDVVPAPGWRSALETDLRGLPDNVAASRGRVLDPEPPPSPTADIAYRRVALAAVGGFDERLSTGYRDDADLAPRVLGAGWRIVSGDRRCLLPRRASDRWAGVGVHAGNAGAVLLGALQGRRSRHLPATSGRSRHLVVTLAGAGALAGLLARRRAVAGFGGAVGRSAHWSWRGA